MFHAARYGHSTVSRTTQGQLCECFTDTNWNRKLKKKKKKINGKAKLKENSATLQVAGTCGAFTVREFKEGALIHPIQPNHVAGVGIQPSDTQAQGVSGQSEVLAFCEILQVCYLNDKAVKFPSRGVPGHSEPVPCNVRDGEVHHHGLQILW